MSWVEEKVKGEGDPSSSSSWLRQIPWRLLGSGLWLSFQISCSQGSSANDFILLPSFLVIAYNTYFSRGWISRNNRGNMILESGPTSRGKILGRKEREKEGEEAFSILLTVMEDFSAHGFDFDFTHGNGRFQECNYYSPYSEKSQIWNPAPQLFKFTIMHHHLQET